MKFLMVVLTTQLALTLALLLLVDLDLERLLPLLYLLQG